MAYHPDNAKKLVDYFTEAQRKLEEGEPGAKFPTFPMCSHEVFGVTNRCLQKWKEKFDDFGVAYDRCKSIQQHLLITMGLTGQFKSQIVKLILSSHGFSEAITHTVKDETKKRTDDEIKNAIQELLDKSKGD